MRTTILILGGTSESAELARRLVDTARYRVITSLAGRTRKPAALPGEVRVGGFGGIDGLTHYLRSESIGRVVDATHPYACAISAHAAEACKHTGVPRLQLWRPCWEPVVGDRWVHVDSVRGAVDHLVSSAAGKTVFLSTGIGELNAFVGLPGIEFVVRLIERPPAGPLEHRFRLVIARGPFNEHDELALLRHHHVDVVVSKNSGGDSTYAKIAAARSIGLPVVMIDRPSPQVGDLATSTADVLKWLAGGSTVG